MRILFPAIALLAIACATPVATQTLPQSAGPDAAQQYVLDPAHTQVAFSVDRFGFNHTLGRFETVSGAVTLDRANPARSSVTATVQTASVSAGDATRNEHLRAERWLNVEQFPTMEFRSTSVRLTGAESAEVTGDLTVRGQTHPITLTVSLNQIGRNPANGGQAAGFSATGTLSRTAFGVGANIPTTLIGDEVRITIEALGQAAAN
jgi:polyisoprenoid-binding protein YceI